MNWRDQAECLGRDPEQFFTNGTGNAARIKVAEAISVCHTCPVVSECLMFAKANRVEGVWGGHLFEGGKSRPVRLPALHGSEAAYLRHRKRGEEPCAECTAEMKIRWKERHARKLARKKETA